MNDQRAFWISGLGSLAVVLLMGSALWARSKPADSNLTAPAPVSAPVLTSPDQGALRRELEVAYSELDAAYREVERLRAASTDDDDHESDDDEERRGERYESEEHQ